MNVCLEEIVSWLYAVGAIKDKGQSLNGKGFRLKLHEQNPNAPLSPFYINLRTPDNPKPGSLIPEIVQAIGRQFYYLARDLNLKYDYVAGVPHAGDPFAEAFLSAKITKQAFSPNPVAIIKLKKEKVGERRKITEVLNEDECLPGKTALILDDLITEANSKIETIIALREKGLVVKDVIVFLDREQGGAEELKNFGCNLHSVFTIRQLLDFYLKNKWMNQETYNEIIVYLDSNN